MIVRTTIAAEEEATLEHLPAEWFPYFTVYDLEMKFAPPRGIIIQCLMSTFLAWWLIILTRTNNPRNGGLSR